MTLPATSGRGFAATTAREAAAIYIARGWQVVPLEPKTKAVGVGNWPALVFMPEDFRPEDNIGLRSTNGLTIVDLDCPETLRLADAFLPPTGAIYGRPGCDRAKRLYQVAPDALTATRIEKHIDKLRERENTPKSTLAELRVNHQDMAPPSIHPNGATLAWAEFGTVGTTTYVVLQHAVRLMSIAAEILRYYPTSNRHDFWVALAGVLCKCGLTLDDSLRLVRATTIAADDEEPRDREQAVTDTYAAHAADLPVKGVTELLKCMSKDRGTPFLDTLRAILGLTHRSVDGFILDVKGARIDSGHHDNMRLALTKLGATLSFNNFLNKAHITIDQRPATPLCDHHIEDLYDKTHTRYFRPPRPEFEHVIRVVSRANAFHPVHDYLNALTWDGTSRLERWLTTYGGAKDTDLIRAFAAITLVAAVRRVFLPKCKFDELLILESPQGWGKSTAIKLLCPDEEWFSDNLPIGADSKVVIEQTAGKWIIEAAELKGEKDAQRAKAFLSRQVDTARLAYRREAEDVPRQFIIIGTTNQGQYLHDDTGNRRFWPVKVQRFDLTALHRDRDQLWAEAVACFHSRQHFGLDRRLWQDAADAQRDREIDDPWFPELDQVYGPDAREAAARIGVLVDRIELPAVWAVLGVPLERQDKANNARVTAIMRQLGYEKKQMRDIENKNNRKRFCLEAKLAFED